MSTVKRSTNDANHVFSCLGICFGYISHGVDGWIPQAMSVQYSKKEELDVLVSCDALGLGLL